MNLLLSSTQVWNPGDDFIRFGVLAILERAWAPTPIHTAIFDRSPRVQKHSSGRDNDQANIHCQADTFAGYDAIVIAGTPAWGKNNDELYAVAQEQSIPLYMLGLGGVSPEHFEKTISPATLHALETARLITVRDQLTADYLTARGIPHYHLPCPATLASLALGNSIPDPDRDTAIITSDVPQTQRHALTLYNDLAGTASAPQPPPIPQSGTNSPIHLICHSSHERNTLTQLGYRPLYEHDPYRLLRLILRYKKVHSARLHGALPIMGANNGQHRYRWAWLTHTHCNRIHSGYTTAQNWFTEGKTAADLLTTYITLLETRRP